MSSGSVVLKVLSHIPGLIPEIDQVILLHYQSDSSKSEGYLLKKNEDGYKTEPIRLDAGSSIIRELGLSNQSFFWFQRDQLPFEIVSKDKIQLTIFSELKNSVLLVKYTEKYSNFTSLFFIYFNENLSNFILDKVTEPFSAQHKNIVGFLLFHSIQTLFRIFETHQQLTRTFDDQIRLIIQERDQLRDELSQSAQKEREGILSLASYYVSQIADELGTKASLTDSAKLKLKSYPGELSQLEVVIRNALEFAGALTTPYQSTPLLLADYHIRFPEQATRRIMDEAIDGLPQRMVKTHLLLDRLELAASGIKQRKENLTSANVGKEFPTPISAPAITDALRKHKKRIIQLFDQYPEKWEIIRHEFRPIQNLMNSALDHELLSA